MRIFLVSLLICVGAVWAAYLWLDKHLVLWCEAAGLRHFEWLHTMQEFPEWLLALLPLGYIVVASRFVMGRRHYFDDCLVLMGGALLITQLMKDLAKGVFGRAWPDTFYDNNPSFLQNGEYGFHFFTFEDVYRSFPSGHTAMTCAAMTIVWLNLPKLRWFAVVACLAVIVGLLGNYYHFLSDVIAGAFLGIWIGICTMKWYYSVKQHQ